MSVLSQHLLQAISIARENVLAGNRSQLSGRNGGSPVGTLRKSSRRPITGLQTTDTRGALQRTSGTGVSQISIDEEIAQEIFQALFGELEKERATVFQLREDLAKERHIANEVARRHENKVSKLVAKNLEIYCELDLEKRRSAELLNQLDGAEARVTEASRKGASKLARVLGSKRQLEQELEQEKARSAELKGKVDEMLTLIARIEEDMRNAQRHEERRTTHRRIESSTAERRKKADEVEMRTALLAEQLRQSERDQLKLIRLKSQLEKEKETSNEARKAAEKVKEDHLCTVCQDEEATMVLLNCGHLCLCPGCCDQIMAADRHICPICRVPVSSTIRTYRG